MQVQNRRLHEISRCIIAVSDSFLTDMKVITLMRSPDWDIINKHPVPQREPTQQVSSIYLLEASVSSLSLILSVMGPILWLGLVEWFLTEVLKGPMLNSNHGMMTNISHPCSSHDMMMFVLRPTVRHQIRCLMKSRIYISLKVRHSEKGRQKRERRVILHC